MLRDRTSRGLAVGVTALTVLAAVVAAVALLTGGGREEPPPPPPILSVKASDLRQGAVERFGGPGYVAWVGAWAMPGGELMTSWVQAEGEVDPARRERAPEQVLDAYGISRAELEPARDFYGLDLSVRYRRSNDGGVTWERFRTDRFQSLNPHGYSQQPTTALADGTIIRRVNGDDLREDDRFPHTAVLQRLEPGADEWSPPQTLLDPARFTYQITRIRSLADGRLIATGNAWDVPASVKPGDRDVPSRFLLMVSEDDGRTWKEGLRIPEGTGALAGNEWDTAELHDGDLLAVMRTATPDERAAPVVRQAVLRKDGDGWVLDHLRDAPFEVTGHPELLRTYEGAILYVATDGVRWTQDGRTWRRVPFRSGREYLSHYYPRSLQTLDGTVHVFSHLGSDHPYRTGEHGVLHDSFKVVVDQAPASPAGG